MSWETQSWAAKQRPGSASAKLVLLGLASCADANHCAFPSVQWLCDFSDLNRKTVISAIQRLEDGMFPLIEDTGERRGRTGQVKVYRLAAVSSDPAALNDPPRQARTRGKTVPKAEQFQKRNSSSSGSKQSQKRDTELVSNLLPPLTAKAVKTPKGAVRQDFDKKLRVVEAASAGSAGKRAARATQGAALPEGWTAPPQADLLPMAEKLVRQWPSGAYEAACETFRLHWQSETRSSRRPRDWRAALAKWLIKDHPQMMRAGKAGVNFSGGAAGIAAAAHPQPPVSAQSCETAHDRAIRQKALQAGVKMLERCAILRTSRGDDTGLTVICPSDFAAHWLADNAAKKIRRASGAAAMPLW